MKLNLFPALFDHPARMKFIEQEEDEHIELLVRQHWVTNVGWVVTAIIVSLLPVLFPTLIRNLNLPILTAMPATVNWALIVLWYMLVLTYIIEKYLFWYFNIYIVTNRHLVDIALQSLLSRNITEVRLDDVQSARSKISGIIRSLFHFGDVIIETAAERQNIQFLAIPRPDFVADRIQDLQELQEGLPGKEKNDVS